MIFLTNFISRLFYLKFLEFIFLYYITIYLLIKFLGILNPTRKNNSLIEADYKVINTGQEAGPTP